MDQRFPTLCKHLTRHGVNVSSMALQWFLCMFVNSLPLESCFRVWDVLFFDLSSSVLFRCGLALVDIYAQVSSHLSVQCFQSESSRAPDQAVSRCIYSGVQCHGAVVPELGELR